MSLNRTQIVDWLYRCGDIFTKESDFLTGLDKEIGDADHGLNMHRGFSKVVEKLPSIADKDIGFILKNTGMTLLSLVKISPQRYSQSTICVLFSDMSCSLFSPVQRWGMDRGVP